MSLSNKDGLHPNSKHLHPNSQLLLWFFEERAPFIVSFRTLVIRLIQLWEFQENCVVFNATHTYQHIYFFLFN